MYKIKMFADGADIEQIRSFSDSSLVAGFTTNPTLARNAGISDYEAFSREAAALVNPLPISIEVLADEFSEMVRQARLIDSWGPNIYVKIPVSNTRGESAVEVIRGLSHDGIKVNVTAVFTVAQVAHVARALAAATPSVVSVFAGRVADAGVDPLPIMSAARTLLDEIVPTSELLWASPREILNLVQAEAVGADIITMTPDLWAKYDSLGKNLTLFSQETVQMFHSDALAAGFTL